MFKRKITEVEEIRDNKRIKTSFQVEQEETLFGCVISSDDSEDESFVSIGECENIVAVEVINDEPNVTINTKMSKENIELKLLNKEMDKVSKREAKKAAREAKKAAREAKKAEKEAKKEAKRIKKEEKQLKKLDQSKKRKSETDTDKMIENPATNTESKSAIDDINNIKNETVTQETNTNDLPMPLNDETELRLSGIKRNPLQQAKDFDDVISSDDSEDEAFLMKNECEQSKPTENKNIVKSKLNVESKSPSKYIKKNETKAQKGAKPKTSIRKRKPAKRLNSDTDEPNEQSISNGIEENVLKSHSVTTEPKNCVAEDDSKKKIRKETKQVKKEGKPSKKRSIKADKIVDKIATNIEYKATVESTNIIKNDSKKQESNDLATPSNESEKEIISPRRERQRQSDDRPRSFERDHGDQPRSFERDHGDQPRSFERDHGDQPRSFERDHGDQPRSFERDHGDQPRSFERDHGDQPRSYQRDFDDRARCNQRVRYGCNQWDRRYQQNRFENFILTRRELSRIRLSRHKLELWSAKSFFANIVVGCFVRIAMDDRIAGRIYEIGEVLKVIQMDKSYKFGNIETCKGLELRISYELPKLYSMVFISNDDFTDHEFDKWLITSEGIRPNERRINSKVKDIQYAIENTY